MTDGRHTAFLAEDDTIPSAEKGWSWNKAMVKTCVSHPLPTCPSRCLPSLSCTPAPKLLLLPPYLALLAVARIPPPPPLPR